MSSAPQQNINSNISHSHSHTHNTPSSVASSICSNAATVASSSFASDRVDDESAPSSPTSPGLESDAILTIIVLGASGDLAKKKTFPALFSLYKHQFFPHKVRIIGYSRSKLNEKDYHSRISSHIKIIAQDTTAAKQLNGFLSICEYLDGKYDSTQDFEKLNNAIDSFEKKNMTSINNQCNRVFYMALPPSVFMPVVKNLRENCYNSNGWNRLIVEKPFGRDLESSRELGNALSALWTEDEIYRIDHYLGKEMVKNLFILRFANIFFSSIWNKECISNIQITFKEKIGTECRGGYFDEFGIIRDVMQNHLLQILSLIAMERPVSVSAKDIRDEKVKCLRFISPVTLNDVILGQYVASTADKSKVGYLDDSTVPKGSNTPTYAAAVFHIANDRWEGVPFIIKCGKALNEQKAEIRIQFKDVPGHLFPSTLSRNELVIRVQPNESVYLKLMNKHPGHSYHPIISELDLSYSDRYQHIRIPDAYEALILDVLRGDQANFVRADELDAAWKIFTPLLHQIDEQKIQPETYEHGSRGPKSVDQFLAKYGVERDRQEYQWKNQGEKSKI